MAETSPEHDFATLAQGPEGEPIVSVITKRTFTWARGGGPEPADEQVPLVRKETLERLDDRPCAVVAAEIDTWPCKLATDVVVTGHARAPGGQPVTEMEAGVQVGEHAKVVRVLGDRQVVTGPDGRPAFTAPAPFTEMPLTYFRAYGGIDPYVFTEPDPGDVMGVLKALIPEERPGAYPRNPAGVGYAVRAEDCPLDGLHLPNFEDPGRLLTPDTLLAGDPAAWWRMPMPQGLSWFNAAWYPRCTFAGVLPPLPAPDDTDEVAEVRMGLVPRGQCARLEEAPVEEWVDMRLANGASPGLVLPFLRGDEPVRLVGLSERGEVRFRLPGAPRVSIVFEGGALDARPFLHTVLIEPDAERFSLVWCHRAPTPRILPDRMPTMEDPTYHLLEGFEITVDGAELAHAREPFTQETGA